MSPFLCLGSFSDCERLGECIQPFQWNMPCDIETAIGFPAGLRPLTLDSLFVSHSWFVCLKPLAPKGCGDGIPSVSSDVAVLFAVFFF